MKSSILTALVKVSDSCETRYVPLKLIKLYFDMLKRSIIYCLRVRLGSIRKAGVQPQ